MYTGDIGFWLWWCRAHVLLGVVGCALGWLSNKTAFARTRAPDSKRFRDHAGGFLVLGACAVGGILGYNVHLWPALWLSDTTAPGSTAGWIARHLPPFASKCVVWDAESRDPQADLCLLWMQHTVNVYHAAAIDQHSFSYACARWLNAAVYAGAAALLMPALIVAGVWILGIGVVVAVLAFIASAVGLL
jgi:hypothetical protein